MATPDENAEGTRRDKRGRRISQRSLDALKAHQFKVGNPGGPGGPRKEPITDEYRRLLGMRLPEALREQLKLPKGATYLTALALRQMQAALKPDTAAAREVTDRVQGRATARIEHTGADGGPIAVTQDELQARLRTLLGL